MVASNQSEMSPAAQGAHGHSGTSSTHAWSVAREVPTAALPTWSASAGKTFPSLPNYLSSHF